MIFHTEKNRGMIISFVVAFLAIILTFVCSGAFASLLMTVFVFASGQLLCRTIGRENRDRGRLLFNIVFSCLTVFACIHYMDTVVDWQAFALDWSDEYKFWKLSETLSGYPSVKSILVDCFINRNVGGFIENQGYVFYIGILAYIAETFLDGNNLLYQFMGSVLFGSLFSIVLYKIFLIYIDGKKVFKYVLIFSLCSVVFSYGFLFLRDVVILFFYASIQYIVLRKFTVRNLVGLILLSFIVFQLREEHGLFSLVFIAYYIYKAFRKIKVLVWLLLLCLPVVFFVYFGTYFDSSVSSMEHYTEFTAEQAKFADGLSLYIFKLPPVIKEVVLFFYSAVSPVPPWKQLFASMNLFDGIVSLHVIVYAIFWYIVFYSAFKWLVLDGRIKRLPVDMIWLSGIAVLFIVLNLSNPAHRRLMAVYPVIYLAYCLVKEKIPRPVVNKNKMVLSGIYVFGLVLYIFLKA